MIKAPAPARLPIHDCILTYETLEPSHWREREVIANRIRELFHQITFEELLAPIPEGRYAGRDVLWFAAHDLDNIYSPFRYDISEEESVNSGLFDIIWAKFKKDLKLEHFLVTRNNHPKHSATLCRLISTAHNKGFNSVFCKVFNQFKTDIPIALLLAQDEGERSLLEKIGHLVRSEDDDKVFKLIWDRYSEEIPLAALLRQSGKPDDDDSIFMQLALALYCSGADSFERVWDKHKHHIPVSAMLTEGYDDYRFSIFWVLALDAVTSGAESLFREALERYEEELTLEYFFRIEDFPGNEPPFKGKSVFTLCMLSDAKPQNADSLLRKILSVVPGSIPEHLQSELAQLGFAPLVEARNDFFTRLEQARTQPLNQSIINELVTSANHAKKLGYKNAFNDVGKWVCDEPNQEKACTMELTRELLFSRQRIPETSQVRDADKVGEKRKLRASC